MKIAILGNSPLALETALRFHLHGAAFTWYQSQDHFSLFDSTEFKPLHYTSDLGHGVLKELGLQYSPAKFDWSLWKASYEKPLVEFLRAHQEVKSDEVVSITKRFIAPDEEIPGRTRFLDLFRVIYKVDPKEFIEDQKEKNPETYERLTNEFVSSLASTIEMYQDYDLVLDLRTDLDKSSAAVSGRALGEGRASDKVHYSMKALKRAKELTPSPEIREIALVGSDSLAAEIIISMQKWIEEPRSRMFIISSEEEPFAGFLAKAEAQTAGKLLDIFQAIEGEFQKDVETFTHKLREWQELDDFVQVKIPKPVEPIPRLNFFSGHSVTALDELIDKKRMFLTLEKPEFREGKKHPENNYLDLKTIGVDEVLISHAKKDPSIINLRNTEPGFFAAVPTRPNINGGWETDLLKIEGIENEIFKLFSPVDSH